MIRPKLCFAAEGIVRDGDTNLVSAFNIFEAIVAPGFPLFIQRMVSFALWERERNDPEIINGHFRVTLDGNLLVEAETMVSFQGLPRTRNFVNVAGLVVPRPGQLLFQFVLTDEAHTHTEYSIVVEASPAQIVAGGEGTRPAAG